MVLPRQQGRKREAAFSVDQLLILHVKLENTCMQQPRAFLNI
jgi:hypothetical protein